MPASRDHDGDFSHNFEHLEPRKLLSASMDGGGTLEIRGTEGDDAIFIEATDVDGQVRVSGVEGVEDGTVFEGVDDVRVRLRDGDDTATASGTFINEDGKLTRFRFHGGQGADVITGGDSRNRILGGAGNDVLTGGLRSDIIRGRAGHDIINGGGGADKLRGDDGNDVINGGDGNDELKGGRGDDDLSGGDGNDELNGGAGTDTLSGGNGDDRLNGNSGDDDVFGGDGDDDFNGDRDEDRDHDADEDRSSDDSGGSGDDDGTDDQGGSNDDDSNGSGDDDGTDDQGGGNNDDGAGDDSGGEHVGLDDDFVALLAQLELNFGDLPAEMTALVNAASDLNAFAGPPMHSANRTIKNFFSDDQLETLVNDDPAEGAGDAVMEAFERMFGGDDGVRDFDGDGDFLDFGDIITSYEILIGEMPDGSSGSLLDAANALISNVDMVNAVESAFESLLAADLDDAFWAMIRISVS